MCVSPVFICVPVSFSSGRVCMLNLYIHTGFPPGQNQGCCLGVPQFIFARHILSQCLSLCHQISSWLYRIQKKSLIIACRPSQHCLHPLFCGGVHQGRHSLLHLTHLSALRRLTGTCAHSAAEFHLQSEAAPAASLGWRGPCRLGKGQDTTGAGGRRQMCCRLWPPRQLTTVLMDSLQIP